MTKDKALKLAANINPYGSVENARARDAAIEALAQPEDTVQRLSALVRAQQITIDKLEAQLEQKPVAYLCENAVGHKYFRWKKPSGTYKPIALYTSPPAQRKPLTITEESAWDLARYVYSRSNLHESPQILLSAMEIKQIIEAAHGIKENT